MIHPVFDSCYCVCVCYLTMSLVQGSQGPQFDQGVIVQSTCAGSPTSLASLLDPCLKWTKIITTISNPFFAAAESETHLQKIFLMYCSLYNINYFVNLNLTLRWTVNHDNWLNSYHNIPLYSYTRNNTHLFIDVFIHTWNHPHSCQQ